MDVDNITVPCSHDDLAFFFNEHSMIQIMSSPLLKELVKELRGYIPVAKAGYTIFAKITIGRRKNTSVKK